MDEQTLKDTLVKELGLEGADEETINNLLIQVGQSIMERTTLAILEKLTLEEQDEFTKLAETGDYQKSYEYAASKIENFDEFVKSEARAEIEELKAE